MGEFVIRQVDRHGRLLGCRRVPNVLAFEGTERLLRRVFPPITAAPVFKLGLSGAFSHTETERPNHPPLVPEIPAYDPTVTLAQLAEAANWPNEGGAPDAETRTLIGYARREVAFTVSPSADGARIETDELAFVNPIQWIQHGDWSPNDPPRPWQPGWEAWEPEVGYPYQIPQIHEDAFWNTDFGAFLASNLFRLGGYPINVAFIHNLGDDGVFSPDDELVASCTMMTAPVLWRPGATLHVRYHAEIQRALDTETHGCTRWFAERMARAMFQGVACCSIFKAALAVNPPGKLTARSTYDDLVLIEHGEPPQPDTRDLTSWAIEPASGLTPPYAYTAEPEPWENEDEDPWPAVTYLVVIADVGGAPHLAWYQAINPAKTLAHGDTLTIDGGVKFELAGL